MLLVFCPIRLDEFVGTPWCMRMFPKAHESLRFGVHGSPPRRVKWRASKGVKGLVREAFSFPYIHGSLLPNPSPPSPLAFWEVFIPSFVIQTTVGRKDLGNIHCFMFSRSFASLWMTKWGIFILSLLHICHRNQKI